MKCTEFPNSICHNEHRPDIKIAGEVVGIDLEKPVDLSIMQVFSASTDVMQRNDGRYLFDCKSILKTRILNEDGDFEYLEIIITRRALKLPTITKT